jgi:polysaccharide pyruvyl transferase WcaK-like protein
MGARRWQHEFLAAADPERTLLEHVTALVDQAGPAEWRWRPGTRLKVLLAGYSGAGNVGTEMRTGEILRQLRHLLGAASVDFSALSLGSSLPPDVLPDVTCLPLAAGYIPEVVLEASRQHHATVACEGSMFKSTFANVLSAIMAGALGMASRDGKLSVGYGAEVAAMDSALEVLVKAQAARSLILCRNEPSYQTAVNLGLRASPGTDTAWTFRAASRERGQALLRSCGWNGVDPVIAICPMNPFWWPVRPSPSMARELRRSGAHRHRHFASLFFHTESPDIERKYRTYLDQLGRAVRDLCRVMSAFPVIVAMDRVDRQACRDLAEIVQASGSVIAGAEHPVGDIVAALRCCDLLISSRFHALVAAMPAGVPSVGIAMDERIRNLLEASSQGERLVSAADPELGKKVLDTVRRLDRAEVARASRLTVGEAIRATGEMGRRFVMEVGDRLPAFPLPGHAATWQAHVAPLPPDLDAFLSVA